MISAKETLKESMPVLLLCAAISIFSGFFLNRSEDLLRILPGLLIILPSFMSINGNIASIITSRLSSALHMGLLKPDFRGGSILKRNVSSMVIVSLVSFPLLGFVAGIFNMIMGSNASFLVLPVVTSLAGLATSAILIVASLFFSHMIYRKGLDPDDTVVPFLTTFGDLAGIAILLMMTGLVV